MPLVPTGAPAAATLVNVEHSCKHTVRWHFFHDRPRLDFVANLAGSLPCPRCGGEMPLARGDAIFWPTGVAHCHDGDCGDEAPDVERWLDMVGARIRTKSILHVDTPRLKFLQLPQPPIPFLDRHTG